MANSGTYRSLIAAGRGAHEVARALVDALGEVDGLTVHQLAPGRLLVARTRRPQWAVVAAVLTIWLGGMGLLFLLVKRTHSGEVTVHDGPRGCTVTVPPVLDASVARRIEEVVTRRTLVTAGAPAPETAFPAGVPADAGCTLEAATVARTDQDAPPPPPPPPPARGPALLRLRFADLTVEVSPDTPVVLGRDPEPGGRAAGVRVPGDATTVSKSHLLVTYDGAVGTVEDLGSTNGTVLVRGDEERPLAPGAPMPVAHGDVVRLGGVECDVEIDA